MPVISDHERARWKKLWQTTVWERHELGQWFPLPGSSPHPLVVISAWNPAGLRLPVVINQARDALLLAELQALGYSPRRARGRCPADSWFEDGWQIAHDPRNSSALLRRYGQIAGWVTDASGAHYHWTASPS